MLIKLVYLPRARFPFCYTALQQPTAFLLCDVTGCQFYSEDFININQRIKIIEVILRQHKT